MGYRYEDEEENIVQNINEDAVNEDLVEINNTPVNKQSVEISTPEKKDLIADLMASDTPIKLQTKPEEKGYDNVHFDSLATYGFDEGNTNFQNIENLLKTDEELELDYNNLITTDDEKYFVEYIGKNYKKITQGKFNFAAFFFGGYYLIYRKIYLEGIVWVLLNLFVSYLLPLVDVKFYIIIIFLLFSYLSCGFSANMIYLNHVGTNILNMKIGNVSDIKKECKKKGGTNILAALLVYLIINGLVFISVYANLISLLNSLGV